MPGEGGQDEVIDMLHPILLLSHLVLQGKQITFTSRLPASLITQSLPPLIMDPVITRIRQELAAQADPEIQKTSQRFFKEDIRCYGMKTATVIAIARKYWKEIKNGPKQEIFRSLRGTLPVRLHGRILHCF